LREIIFRPCKASEESEGSRKSRSPQTQGNDRRALCCFFNWAVAQGYAESNPIQKIKAPRFDMDEPEILSTAEVRKVIEETSTFKGGKLVPYVILAMFAAIRPAELERLTWDSVDLEAKAVTISGRQAKLRQRRIVELSDNAVQWLLPHALKRTPIKGVNWRRDVDEIKRAAGFRARSTPGKPWAQDILRHTGISNHFALHEHEGKTALWAGNSPDMIHRHYKGLVSKREAAEFFGITPDSGKIVATPARRDVELAAA